MSYVDKISVGGNTHLVEPTLFAVVGGTSAAYTATIDNFELVQGVVVTIKIGNNLTNSANVTLNINSTGAKNIIYEGNNVSAGALLAGRIYSMVAINTSNTWTWELLNKDITSSKNGIAYYSDTSGTFASTSAGSDGYVLIGKGANTAPNWLQATSSNTASTIVQRDSSGNFSAGTIVANLTGTATNAEGINWSYGATNNTDIDNLQSFFPDAPKNKFTAMRSSHSTASMAMGYFIDGTNYNTIQTAWGGWYIAEYYKPSYVSIANGTWTQNEILTAASYNSYALPLTGGTLTGDVYIDKSSGDTGIFVKNTTRDHQVGLIVGGSSGYGGIYDTTYTKWIVYSDSTGTVGLNGNASTATQWAAAQKVYVTLGTASTTTTIQGGSTIAQTIGVNGTLGAGNGGTGNTSFTAGRLIYAETASKLSSASSLRLTTNNALSIFPTGGNYCDGIRLHARSSDDTWAAITLCGADNTGDTGTSANTWFIGAKNGEFYITRNGSSTSSTTMLSCIGNYWLFSNGNGSQQIFVEGTAESYVRVRNTTTGCYVYLDSAGNGAHGIYSYGYGSSSSSYTQSGKWLICRDANGITQLPPDITITSANNDGGIYYAGTKARYRMIRFIDNTANGNGNGIIIGGGGLTMIGGGESANTLFSNLSNTGESEQMIISSDNSIYFYTDQGSGYTTAHYAVLSANGLSVGSAGDTTCEKDIYVKSGAGNLAMYSAASSTGNRGLWAAAHGTASTGKTFILIDTNNNISYKANTKGCSWLTGQNDSSKTAILIEDDGTSTNNYFPWIQMTARSTDNKSYWLSVGNYQHQLNILSSITTRTAAGYDHRWCFDPVSGAVNSYINAGENGGGFSIYQGSTSVVQMRMGQAGTTTQNGTGFLSLGNGVASGTANNAYGYLRMYGTDANYWNIYGNYAPGATRTLTLPNISGCIATIPTRGTAVGSSSRPVYMSAQGQATAVTYTARTALTLNTTSFQENLTTSGKESVYYRLGNLVYVEIHVKAKAAVGSNNSIATGLPVPTVPLYFTLLNTSNNTQLQCLLNSSGNITNQSAITSGHVFYGTLVYILA